MWELVNFDERLLLSVFTQNINTFSTAKDTRIAIFSVLLVENQEEA